jgi:hypothetical protein
MRQPVAGTDYPTDSQLKEALRTLVAAIPEEKQGETTSEAAELLYGFIDYHAQPDPDDEDDGDEDDGDPDSQPHDDTPSLDPPWWEYR